MAECMTRSDLISGLKVIWTWATCEIIDRNDCPKIAAICDAALEALNDRPGAARLLTWEELYSPDGPVFVEYNHNRVTLKDTWMFVDYIDDNQQIHIARFYRQHGEMESYSANGYGVTWRCWDRRPTTEEMEATPWRDSWRDS